MDKKNTMLLTVIAVATLLVAVVGATFAYFSVVGENNTSSTDVDVDIANVGTVMLEGSEVAHLNLAAVDMAQSVAGTNYYATVDPDNSYNTDAEEISLGIVTASGGTADITYYCEFTMTTEVTGTMVNVLKAGDAEIVYSGGNLTGTYDITDLDPTTVAAPTDQDPNATEITKYSRSESIKVALTGADADTNTSVSEEYFAVVKVTNRDDVTDGDGTGVQNYLAGTEFSISINTSDFVCDTTGYPSDNAAAGA